MNDTIAVAGGSVTGRHHRRADRGCQDAFAWQRAPGCIVAAVCDGCGSGRRSEVGAALGARLWTRAVAARAGGDLGDPALWAAARADVVARLGDLADALGGDRVATVVEHFLFTTVVAAMTPRQAAVFALGDGLYAIDGDVRILGPFADDRPPYVGYDLLGAPPPATVLDVRAAASVDSILLASDGVCDLLARADQPAGLGGAPVGPLSQFWTDDQFVRNPDAVRRRLAVINQEVVRVDAARGVVERGGQPLADDTTIVVIRRVS